MPRFRLAAAAAALAIPAAHPTLAQDSLVLDPILVTAGLTPAPTDAVGRAFTIFTNDEIRATGATYAADALRGLPGLTVTQTGSGGGVTQIRLRGNAPEDTLVLIDGVEVSTPEDGVFDFGGLLATDIERIEVLRGPQSSLFGSNASGGVISIVTKGADTPGVVRGGGFELQSDGGVAGTAFVRARTDRGGIAFSLAGHDLPGFDVADDGGDKDGDVNVSTNLRGDVAVTDTLTVGGSLRYVARESDYDNFAYGAPTPEGLVVDGDLTNKRRELYASLYATARAFDGRVEHGPVFALTDVNSRQYDEAPLFPGPIGKTTDQTGKRYTLRYQAKIALDAATLDAADQSLTLAAEAKRETFQHNDADIVADPSMLDEQSRDLYGFIGEYRGHFDRADVQVGLRHDINDDFADSTTWSAAIAVPLASAGDRVHASAGTGVTNPTMIEQFGYYPGQFVGNPDLKPESSFGWDLGVAKSFWGDRGTVDVTYFNQTVEDEIVTVYPAPDFLGTPINEDGESDRQGVEVSASLQVTAALGLAASYTYTDATNPDGSREVRVPRHAGRLAATYAVSDRGSLQVEGIAAGDVYDYDYTADATGVVTPGAEVKLDDYLLVNLTGSWQVDDQVEAYAGVRNLFDADYAQVYGYATEGVVAFAGLRAQF